ncbi:hypothetical protein [Halovenus sp. HT40]|uniref:hypothetical protein n=1 Tax=Halovenus sp. HT40 TaxID=3126691 RepID=UPI00300F3CEE
MERRKFLIGAGSLAAGGAAALGSGAFTTVEADRELSIETAGDANAFLSIKRATDGSNVYPNAEEYVEGNQNSGTLRLDFTNADDTADASASGINQNAKTVFDNLLDITNNGTQEVEISVDSDLIASQGGSLGVYAENTLGDGGSDNTGLSSSDTGQTATLGVGDSLTNIGVYVPKGKAVEDLSGGTLTIVAERTGGNQD